MEENTFLKILAQREELEPILQSKNKKLLVFLGLLGDFDSFEYVQLLIRRFEQIRAASIDLLVLGIGTNASKEKFCAYTGLPKENLTVFDNSNLHQELLLHKGIDSPFHNSINLFLMCLGIQSPGTIQEVFRGYSGDPKASKLFSDSEEIIISSFIRFKGDLFNSVSRADTQRPFELATLRLLNMKEVLSNWNLYMFDSRFLTQRTGTFFLDESNKILYEYKSKSLLGYSSDMSKPLSFLQDGFTLINEHE